MRFNLSSENCSNKIAIIALIITIIFNIIITNEQNKTLKASEKIASADYILKLGQDIDSGKYDKVTNIIYESNQTATVLYTKENTN